MTARYGWFVAKLTGLGGLAEIAQFAASMETSIGGVLGWTTWGLLIGLIFCETWQYLRPEAPR